MTKQINQINTERKRERERKKEQIFEKRLMTKQTNKRKRESKKE